MRTEVGEVARNDGPRNWRAPEAKRAPTTLLVYFLSTLHSRVFTSDTNINYHVVCQDRQKRVLKK